MLDYAGPAKMEGKTQALIEKRRAGSLSKVWSWSLSQSRIWHMQLQIKRMWGIPRALRFPYHMGLPDLPNMMNINFDSLLLLWVGWAAFGVLHNDHKGTLNLWVKQGKAICKEKTLVMPAENTQRVAKAWQRLFSKYWFYITF